ncbi:hypothetical protein POM88_015700 [Heracleum sosnowskyi]|uniref:Uncharacterized protein n=1 Tax=Heracleum sosnowskyi TaxID=360622 RepID=A0AAD8INC9_9APIA|nr:hypothetical protein POM88_015700 [Heracleum sosnowskyi]
MFLELKKPKFSTIATQEGQMHFPFNFQKSQLTIPFLSNLLYKSLIQHCSYTLHNITFTIGITIIHTASLGISSKNMAIVLEEVDTLVKMTLFVIVQALIYVILTHSSDVFSTKKMIRSLSFKPPRNISIRRMLSTISEVPESGEESPSSIQEYQGIDQTIVS